MVETLMLKIKSGKMYADFNTTVHVIKMEELVCAEVPKKNKYPDYDEINTESIKYCN